MSPFDDSEICRSILERLPTGLCVMDLQKRIVFWSNGAERITGHLHHEIIGHSCVAEPLLHCDHPGCEFCSDHCPAARAMKASHSTEGTGFLRHKAGYEIPVRIRAVPVHDCHGSVIGAVETFENLQSAASLGRGESVRYFQNCVDPVTGVADLAMMHSHLRQSLATFRETQLPFAILLLRVERLANFRASFGSEAASSLLRVIARTLESVLWVTDFVGRWSDDQFLAIVSARREEEIFGVRERIRQALAGEAIEWWGERHSLPITIGETTSQVDDTVESLLERVMKSLAASAAWRMPATTQANNPSGGQRCM